MFKWLVNIFFLRIPFPFIFVHFLDFFWWYNNCLEKDNIGWKFEIYICAINIEQKLFHTLSLVLVEGIVEEANFWCAFEAKLIA